MRFYLCNPQLHLYNVYNTMCIFRNYVPVTVNDSDFTEDTLIRLPNYT